MVGSLPLHGHVYYKSLWVHYTEESQRLIHRTVDSENNLSQHKKEDNKQATIEPTLPKQIVYLKDAVTEDYNDDDDAGAQVPNHLHCKFNRTASYLSGKHRSAATTPTNQPKMKTDS